MPSTLARSLLRPELPRLPGKTTRAAVLALLLAVIAAAQPTPAALTNRVLPPGGVDSPTVIDSAGNVYVTGGGSPVTLGAAQTQAGGGECVIGGQFLSTVQPCSDAQVTKFDASGNLVFSTLLGGPTADTATAIAIDAAGNVYLTGTTGGQFPVTSKAASAGPNGAAFAAKISADGATILYSTLLPAQMTVPAGIAVDAQGDAYIAGKTVDNHGFLLKIDSTGATFLWTALFSGSSQDAASAVALDSTGNVVVAGRTNSPDLPVTSGVYQPRLAGTQNLFLAKVDPTGAVLFATYLGGSGADVPNQLAIDRAGNIVLAGSTTSLDFPTTANSYEPTALVPLWNNDSPGGFAARISPDGRTLLSSTYIPASEGRGLQSGITAIAIAPSGDLYLAGIAGAEFPVTPSAPQPCLDQSPLDAFVAHLDANGALRDATYIAAANLQQGLAVMPDGRVLAGWHLSGPSVILAQIQFGGAGFAAPPCVSPAALNAATQDTDGHVSPGEFVTLAGFGMGPDTGAAADLSQSLALTLGGVQVLFDGHPAPMLYAQSRQINVQVPFSIAPNSLTTLTVNYNGSQIGQFTAQTNNGEPGIFRLQPNVSNQAFALNPDGTLNSASNPAPAGSIVTLFGTGFGPLAQPCTAGTMNATGFVNLAAGYNARFNPGGPIGTVEYAGSAPGYMCGVYQIGLQIPAGIHPGPLTAVPVAFTGDTGSSAHLGGVIYIE